MERRTMTENGVILEIRDLKYRWNGTGKELFNALNLFILENKITCILGPSGCGKTTLLNLIGGF